MPITIARESNPLFQPKVGWLIGWLVVGMSPIVRLWDPQPKERALGYGGTSLTKTSGNIQAGDLMAAENQERAVNLGYRLYIYSSSLVKYNVII